MLRKLAALLLVAVMGLLFAMTFTGCGGESRYHPTAPIPNDRDTCYTCPCDTTTPPAPTNGNCGEINTGAFNVTAGQPLKYLYSYYFSGLFSGRMFARIQNYREGGGHTNQDVQFYAVRDGDNLTVVVKRPGDTCGVLADTTGVDGSVTRYVGDVDLPAGSWSFYAIHGSRVDCWTQSGNGNGPVDVVDTQFEWCYHK